MIPRPRCARVKCPVDTLVLAPGMFIVIHNRKTFRILFLADNLGKILFISSVGKDAFTFSVQIPNDFHAPKFFIGDNYGNLVDYLKTKGSSNNSLIPHDFLITIFGSNSPLLAAREPFEYNVLERTDYSGRE